MVSHASEARNYEPSHSGTGGGVANDVDLRLLESSAIHAAIDALVEAGTDFVDLRSQSGRVVIGSRHSAVERTRTGWALTLVKSIASALCSDTCQQDPSSGPLTIACAFACKDDMQQSTRPLTLIVLALPSIHWRLLA